MKTQYKALRQVRPATITSRYGITESKKAELDALSLQVIDAQYDVNKFQSIVTSLTDKVNNFQGFLATAENTRTQAYNNKILMDQLLQNAIDLKNNSNIAFNEIVVADSKTKDLSTNIKMVIDKLIYSVDVLNKLSAIVTRKKALNPLISDELISVLATAGSDANNAIALTLIALKSTFAAQASNTESEAAIELAYTQSDDLYECLIGAPDDDNHTGKKETSLDGLLHDAYTNAKENYHRMEKALAMSTKQLNDAKSDLNKAQIKLKSLQSGLAAANAAALAS
jgi:hypothetical protein